MRQVRMARVNEVVLLDHPADTTGPRSINCYLVEVQDAATLGANSKKFKIVSERLLYMVRLRRHAVARRALQARPAAARSAPRRNGGLTRKGTVCT